MPDVVSVLLSCVRAMPKSARTARPVASISTFPGLTSRCMMPSACAAFKAVSTCSPTAAACCAGSGPFSCTTSRNDRDGTSSMTIQGRPSSSTTS